jgi:outer membrane lipase/esterase
MLRALVATTALAGGLMLAGMAQAAPVPSPFSSETVFGDSLSDAGNIALASGSPVPLRFTTNPGLTAVEDLGAYYGIQPTASLAGGTDFAWGGAGVNTNAPGTPAGVPTITTQITGYLAANPKVSGSTLFSVFGGANDIFYHATAAAAYDAAAGLVAADTAGLPPAIAAAVTAQIDAEVAQAAGVTTLESPTDAATAVGAAASQEITLIGGLQKAGAHYILVFNLPDIGKTPEAAAEDAASPGAAAALTQLSQGFNTTLNGGLATLKVGIIPVNTYALLDEVLANPSAYGFVNATTPACTTASSINCTPATLVTANAASTYVFADGVHPTTAMHALFAQYVEAEITAPAQVSLLGEAPLAGLEAERGAVSRELLHDDISDQTGVRLFASGGYTHQSYDSERYTAGGHSNDGLITAGVDWRPNLNVSVGAEISGGEASTDLSGQLKGFHTDQVMGSVFGQYLWRGAYVNGAAGFGTLTFHDIQRIFALGADTRVEDGSTSGTTASASVEGGYWFGFHGLHTGPVVGLAYDHVSVDAYGEKSGDSSAMQFEGQTRDALVARAGWRVQGAFPIGAMVLKPFAEAAYNDDADAHLRYVTAGLTTMNGEFSVPGFSPDRTWGSANAGVELTSGPWAGYVAYQGRFAGRTTDYDTGVVGVSYAF